MVEWSHMEQKEQYPEKQEPEIHNEGGYSGKKGRNITGDRAKITAAAGCD